jgi:hypothetical protein
MQIDTFKLIEFCEKHCKGCPSDLEDNCSNEQVTVCYKKYMAGNKKT